MGDSINPFAVLGVDEAATVEEITAAYRARAKILHPDGLFEGRDDDRRAAEAAMAELNHAHQLLTDDATRKQYRRAQTQRRAAAAWREAAAPRGTPSASTPAPDPAPARTQDTVPEPSPAPPPVSRNVHFSGTYRETAVAEFTVDTRTVGTPWVATRKSRVFRRQR